MKAHLSELLPIVKAACGAKTKMYDISLGCVADGNVEVDIPFAKDERSKLFLLDF